MAAFIVKFSPSMDTNSQNYDHVGAGKFFFLRSNRVFILENIGTSTPHVFSLSIYGSRSLVIEKFKGRLVV